MIYVVHVVRIKPVWNLEEHDRCILTKPGVSLHSLDFNFNKTRNTE